MALGVEDEFKKYMAVLDEAERFTGYFLWKPIAADWVREHLECQPKGIELLLCKHRSKIEQIVENRPIHRDNFDYWYKLIVTIGGERIFTESVFIPGSGDDDNPDMIRVVSVHEQRD